MGLYVKGKRTGLSILRGEGGCRMNCLAGRFACMAAAAVLLVLSSASAQDPSSLPSYSTRIAVVISGDDGIDVRVKSFLTRELRDLPGVLVVGSDPDWILVVIAREMRNQIGSTVGFAICYTVLWPFDNTRVRTWNRFAGVKLSDEWVSFLEDMTTGLCSFKDQALLSGPLDGLKEACENIVVNLDVKHLEPERQAWQEISDELSHKMSADGESDPQRGGPSEIVRAGEK